ncbi:MAG: 2-hydroxyacid dehydrogenase [Ghiorsea sp.]
MNILFFSAKPYDRICFDKANKHDQHNIRYIDAKLTLETASLVRDTPIVCVFVNDTLNAGVLEKLAEGGVQLIALRCAGYNNVDMKAARKLGLVVVRVPAYSPYAVAEHSLCLILALNRKVHKAYNRVREGNFALNGLLGFDFHGRTAGIVGTGRIGKLLARTLNAMGMKVLAYDPFPISNPSEYGFTYCDLNTLLSSADVVSLHCPLNAETFHIINKDALKLMKKGVMIINTSRGALLDAKAITKGLKSEKIGYLGLDVYEQESELFFEDLSSEIIQDDVFERLLMFPNVLITSHQGFFTREAIDNIARTTLDNIQAFKSNKLATIQSHIVT